MNPNPFDPDKPVNMWPGIASFNVTQETTRDKIDVTTFNDIEPQYVMGLARTKYRIAIECNQQAMERLWAVVNDQDVTAKKPVTEPTIVEANTGREITLKD